MIWCRGVRVLGQNYKRNVFAQLRKTFRRECLETENNTFSERPMPQAAPKTATVTSYAPCTQPPERRWATMCMAAFVKTDWIENAAHPKTSDVISDSKDFDQENVLSSKPGLPTPSQSICRKRSCPARCEVCKAPRIQSTSSPYLKRWQVIP
jgi:hypothetical protein